MNEIKAHTDGDLLVASTILRRLKVLGSYEPSAEDMLRNPDYVHLKNRITLEREKLDYGTNKDYGENKLDPEI